MASNMKLIREFNSMDVEIYKIVNDDWSEIKCYFMLLDLHRKSSLNDYPELKNIENETEFGRDNIIKGIVLTKSKLSERILEEISHIVTRLTEYEAQPSCDIKVEFMQISSKDFENIQKTRKKLLNYFENIISSENVHISIVDNNSTDFNHLSQRNFSKSSI